MTPILGETKDGRKTTQKSLKVLPEVGDLRRRPDDDAAAGLSGTSGINAIAHSVEALYAEDSNPIISVLAEQSIAALGRALPQIAAEPRRPRGALRRAVRRLPRRRLPGLGRHGAAPQALPHAGRHCSTCRIPRRTRSCCRMRWPTTRRPCPGPSRRWRGRSASTTRRVALFDLARQGRRAARAARARHAGKRHRQGDRPSRSPIRTGIRGRWSGRGIRELIARAWAGEEPLR